MRATRKVGSIAAIFFSGVEDARAALDAWSPKAFGPQATVQGSIRAGVPGLPVPPARVGVARVC